MGCGCGGGGRKNVVRQGQPASTPVNQVAARQVQPVRNQPARQVQPSPGQAARQALVQKTKERLQQNQAKAVGAREDIEKRRRIQVSLRNRNGRPNS